MTTHEQKAQEMAEALAKSLRISVGLSYTQEHHFVSILLRELNLVALLEDKAMLDKLEKLSPVAIWSGTFSDSEKNVSLGRAGTPITTISTMDEDGCETDKEISRGDSLRTAITKSMKETLSKKEREK